MALVESLQELVMMGAIGLVELFKLCHRRYYIIFPTLAILYFWTRSYIKNANHIDFLSQAFPGFFTPQRVAWIYNYSLTEQQLPFLAVILFIICIALGWHLRFIRTKFIRIFTIAGLVNAEGDTPKLVYKRKLDKHRIQYDFDANGLGIGEFDDRRERIESLFKQGIESIRLGKHQGRVLITFNKHRIPAKLTYEEISAEKALPTDSFYVGQSIEGVISQKIGDLPHMLVAGTTGSGKSVFFKGCLVSLLESCKHLSLYIIDLKGGLEAIDFKEAPNVKIIKKMDDAVTLLRQVDKEMKSRFDFLEENGLKVIEPGRDKKERIVVAIDEASVLFMNRNRFDDDFQSALEARKLVDSISKLSRAAAIHLILATQKLDREVLPTSVSENISGRVAFRANSLQGSLVVLGSKEAYDLPEIPGRGIWNVGNKKLIIQAPYIEDSYIKKVCRRIKNQFDANEKKLFRPLIGEAEKAKAKQDRKSIQKNTIEE